MGEVPAGGDVGQRAVERPGEAVERAAHLGAATVVVLELAAAVEAGVGEGSDRPVTAPNDEERELGQLVHDVVAGLGDVLLAAGGPTHPPGQAGAGGPLG